MMAYILSRDSNIMILFPLITTIPISFLEPSLQISTVSSTTKFMKGSNPLKNPLTCRPPLSFRESFLSMYFFNSGGWALLLMVVDFQGTRVSDSDFPTTKHVKTTHTLRSKLKPPLATPPSG